MEIFLIQMWLKIRRAFSKLKLKQANPHAVFFFSSRVLKSSHLRHDPESCDVTRIGPHMSADVQAETVLHK